MHYDTYPGYHYDNKYITISPHCQGKWKLCYALNVTLTYRTGPCTVITVVRNSLPRRSPAHTSGSQGAGPYHATNAIKISGSHTVLPPLTEQGESISVHTLHAPKHKPPLTTTYSAGAPTSITRRYSKSTTSGAHSISR